MITYSNLQTEDQQPLFTLYATAQQHHYTNMLEEDWEDIQSTISDDVEWVEANSAGRRTPSVHNDEEVSPLVALNLEVLRRLRDAELRGISCIIICPAQKFLLPISYKIAKYTATINRLANMCVSQ